MEIKGRMHGAYFIPDGHTLYAAQVLTQQLYAQVITTLRELAGGGHDHAALVGRRLRRSGAARPHREDAAVSGLRRRENRVKFFKLAWDAVGSEFASRHTQYEMFYAGATFVTKAHSFRTFDWDRCTRLVDEMLDTYSLESEFAAPRAAA